MKAISLLFLAFILTSCASTKPQVQYIEKPIFIKCQIPEIPKANIKPIPENATYPEKLQYILNNYFELEKENKLLREAVKLCQ